MEYLSIPLDLLAELQLILGSTEEGNIEWNSHDSPVHTN
jgi:hypothetical protein